MNRLAKWIAGIAVLFCALFLGLRGKAGGGLCEWLGTDWSHYLARQ